jgi:hypothetical protein
MAVHRMRRVLCSSRVPIGGSRSLVTGWELSRTFVGEPMAQRGVEARTDIRTLRRDLTKNIAVDSISLSVLRYGSASRD